MRRVAVTGAFQRRAHRADTSVHHVGGGHDIGAGRRMRQRLIDQHLDGLIVQYVAGLVDKAVLPMAGEGVERDVGNDAQFRQVHS